LLLTMPQVDSRTAFNGTNRKCTLRRDYALTAHLLRMPTSCFAAGRRAHSRVQPVAGNVCVCQSLCTDHTSTLPASLAVDHAAGRRPHSKQKNELTCSLHKHCASPHVCCTQRFCCPSFC
jgi:hypothetical protein